MFLEWILNESTHHCALGIRDLFATALAQSRQQPFKNANLIMALFCLNPCKGSMLHSGHNLDTKSTIFYWPVAPPFFSRLVSPPLPPCPPCRLPQPPGHLSGRDAQGLLHLGRSSPGPGHLFFPPPSVLTFLLQQGPYPNHISLVSTHTGGFVHSTVLISMCNSH